MYLIQVSIERAFCCLLIILVGLLVYKLLFGFTALRVEDNFNLSVCTATRGHPYKLFLTRFTDVRKYFYCNRVVKIWNELPSDTVLHVLIHSSTDLVVVRACNFHLQSLRHLRPSLTFESAKSMSTAIIGARHQPPVQHYRAEPQPSPEGTERDGLHRASCFLPDERHVSAPTAAPVTYQTTDHVQAGDPYFQGEVLSDRTVSSRTASRPPGCQGTSIYYRSTALPTICVTVFASRAFYYSAPQDWNCLGTSTRSTNTFSSFRRCLNSELFTAAYDT